jgi:hypothetical protein
MCWWGYLGSMKFIPNVIKIMCTYMMQIGKSTLMHTISEQLVRQPLQSDVYYVTQKASLTMLGVLRAVFHFLLRASGLKITWCVVQVGHFLEI